MQVKLERGKGLYGPEEVLLEKDDNLIGETPFAKRGYGVAPFLPEKEQGALRSGIGDLIERCLREVEGAHLTGFAPGKYHTFVDDALHAQFVEKIRHGFPPSWFPLPFGLVTKRISEICGVALQLKNPLTKAELFCVRVVRPASRDFNPPHRDVWLDRLRNAVNIYVPISGSNEKSSLTLVPGSHLWKESEIERTRQGAVVHGVVYTVPAVTGAKRRVRMIRPNPGPQEVLVFSPYLIHGGAANKNTDATRVSLEIRFWRRES